MLDLGLGAAGGRKYSTVPSASPTASRWGFTFDNRFKRMFKNSKIKIIHLETVNDSIRQAAPDYACEPAEISPDINNTGFVAANADEVPGKWLFV